IRIASHFIPGSTCLSNALAGQILFSSYGHKTRLHIGVARDQENTLEAHAWLSLEGATIVGGLPDLDRYKELPSLPTNNS
ncbi:MAG: lasso peptide biosynthesis B2 protein, partial [Proteobacteria bacterium]|nr:lasso peptide biosynthesis B2 protein [Pseudomonadota bacterium]